MASQPNTPSDVILTQPGMFLQRERHLEDDDWIPKPLHVPDDTLRGLEVLCQATTLRVIRSTEKGTICGGDLRYSVTGKLSKKAFSGVEDTSCCCVFWCGPSRSFVMRLYNKWERETLRFVRPFRCDGEGTICCCCPCSFMRINVILASNDETIGTVTQKYSFLKNVFEVATSDNTETLRIVGKAVPCRCSMDQTFQIQTESGEKIGEIWKQRYRENPKINTDHETFGIDYPENASSTMKAILLGAAFLLNHTFFEMS